VYILAVSGPKLPFMQVAANGWFEPALLRNSLLRLQILEEQKTVLRESKYSKKLR